MLLTYHRHFIYHLHCKCLPEIHPFLVLFMVPFDTYAKINVVKCVLHFYYSLCISCRGWVSATLAQSYGFLFSLLFGFLLFNSLGLNPSGIDFCDWWEVRVQIQIFPGREPVVVLSYLKLAILSHWINVKYTHMGSLLFSSDTCQS